MKTLLRHARFAVALAIAVYGPFHSSSAGAVPTGPIPLLISQGMTHAPKGFGGLCAKYPWACSASKQRKLEPLAVIETARKIKTQVNREVRGATDLQIYGVIDKWLLPLAGKGDCEDFALLKKKRLIDAGIAPSDALMAVVLDRGSETHVVLVLRTPSGEYVLDNLTPSMLRIDATDHVFIAMQKPANPSRWELVLRKPIRRGETQGSL